VPLIEVATYGTPDASGGGGAALSLVLNCAPGGIGVLEAMLPLSFNPALLLEDGRIGVWRAINGRAPYLDNGAIFQIRYLDFGPESIFVRAFHASNLLDRRIIAYAAGSSYTTKAATFADDQIKAFMNENMLTGIVGADRDGVETYADVSAYLTKQANLSQGASVAKSAARRRLLDVCTDLANASTTAGVYLTFEVFAASETTLELRTYAQQRGVDRRFGNTAGVPPVVLSSLRGNLTDAHLIIDYTEAASFIVAGGQGEETERLIGTAFDATRAANSPFGRIERFRDAANVSTQAAVDDEADTQLRASRPRILFTGELVETPALTRGIDFDLGDIVTAEHPTSGQQYDVRLDMIKETIDPRGRRLGCGLRSI
jgi:ReqiPepy6 Gp37-like protein